eukprot:6922795-Prymnesium_polylepis.1
MMCLKSSACRQLPMSTTLGNSWQGCKCRPMRIASLISAASGSGSCVHVRVRLLGSATGTR